jgi:putative tryptophan/tyrosine transport system substrate-binding protein
MRRREFMAGLVGAATTLPMHARSETAAAKVFCVGLLSPGALIVDNPESGAAFLQAMKERGYLRGQNLVVEARAASGRIGDLPKLAAELVAAKVDVILTNGFPTALAAKNTGLPTVAASGVGDPVATGLVDSLAHPGGNLTGISDVATELTTKRLGLLKEIAPALRRIAMIWNEDDLGMTLRYRASAEAAQSLGVQVQPLGVREPDDLEAAFAAMRRERPDAILMVADALTVLNRKRIFEFALEQRLPAIYEVQALVRDGGLMSYAADLKESFGRAAALVDAILKGARPADLPFEQPTRYNFAINLRTANAIGLEVPPMLLARADEVIE